MTSPQALQHSRSGWLQSVHAGVISTLQELLVLLLVVVALCENRVHASAQLLVLHPFLVNYATARLVCKRLETFCTASSHVAFHSGTSL